MAFAAKVAKPNRIALIAYNYHHMIHNFTLLLKYSSYRCMSLKYFTTFTLFIFNYV